METSIKTGTKGKVNFLETKLENVCGKDKLRPTFGNVYFKNGFLYATDTHIAIKQAISLHGIDEDGAALLDDKAILGTYLKSLRNVDAIEITENGIKAIKNGIEQTIPFSILDSRYPNVDAVIPTEVEAASNVCFNPKLLQTLCEAMVYGDNGCNGQIKLEMTGGNRAKLVSTDIPKDQQIGVIMPAIWK